MVRTEVQAKIETQGNDKNQLILNLQVYCLMIVDWMRVQEELTSEMIVVVVAAAV